MVDHVDKVIEKLPATRKVSAPTQSRLRRVVQTVFGKALFWHFKLLQQHRYDSFVLERVDGTPIMIVPGVFNPKLLRTGAFFATQLTRNPISTTASVLDMGTGSGICAVFAARHAQRVVAVDINPSAVRCARINALLNDLEGKIEVREGDLFDPIRTERFDVVLFNPPFLRGAPGNELDRAWRSTDVVERFAAELGAHLTPSGYALLLLSSFGDAMVYIEEFRRHGFADTVLAERGFVNERLTIFKLVQSRYGMESS